MSSLGASDISASSGAVFSANASPILSGYQADDERSLSIASPPGASIISDPATAEHTPSPPNPIFQTDSKLGSYPKVVSSQVEGLQYNEGTGDHDRFNFAFPTATLLSGEKLSNNIQSQYDEVVKEEGYIRSRIFLVNDSDESRSGKRRRITFL